MSIKRFVPSAGLAIGTTTAIGIFMAAMIATEFIPQEKGESLGYEIKPVEPDIELTIERLPPEIMQRVETPPPPPVIERYDTDIPKTPPTEVRGEIPDFKFPEIEPVNFKVLVADGDPQPILRGAPLMPTRAERSGHCTVAFDVSTEGRPYNVNTTFCTQNLFERSTIKSVQKWKFKPRILNGRPVSMSGLKNRVTYRLTDERGRIIPE